LVDGHTLSLYGRGTRDGLEVELEVD